MGAGASAVSAAADEALLSRSFKALPSSDQEKLRAALKLLDGDREASTSDLRDYFKTLYRQGGTFKNAAYEECDITGEDQWTWVHKPTGIQVWRDAIDLTSGEGGEVFFHYTSELAFRNITHPSKAAAEVWASLNTEGPNANAWWGKGVYTVPSPPDAWESREQLLDNNFRNMMRRDREDPERGLEYVKAVYPKRVAYCIPLILDPIHAYDVATRATPEMLAAGKEPGRNLADKLLNEPGRPPRSCVVLRVNGQEGIQHARGRLLDALRKRGRRNSHDVRLRLGEVLDARGFYDEALPLLQALLEESRRDLGAEHHETLAAQGSTAQLLYHMGKFSEAETLYRQCFEVRERTLGPEHYQSLISLSGLAVVLDDMGRPKEAEELHRRCLEIAEKTLGKEHPETLASANNLGSVLSVLGRQDEAEDVYRRCLEVSARTQGAEHPDTLMAMSNLASVLDDLEKYAEAETMSRKCLEMNERILGPEHPDVLSAVSNLANVLCSLEQYQEAEVLYVRCLEARERLLGKEHPDTLGSINNLASVMTSQGKQREAEGLYRNCLEAMERTLGDEHPSTVAAANNLAQVLEELCEFSEAEALYRRCLTATERTLGREHPDRWAAMSSLASVLRARGKSSEAKSLLSKAVEEAEDLLGDEHEITQDLQSELCVS